MDDSGIEEDILQSRQLDVEQKQEKTEREVDKIGVSLFDSRRDSGDKADTIRWAGKQKIERNSKLQRTKVIFQNGRYRPKIAWTHEAETPGVDGGPAEIAEESDYLFVPFDDSTPPYYISSTSFENDGSAGATPAGTEGGMSTWMVNISEDSVDARKVGRFIQISACCGDQYFVSP